MNDLFSINLKTKSNFILKTAANLSFGCVHVYCLAKLIDINGLAKCMYRKAVCTNANFFLIRPTSFIFYVFFVYLPKYFHVRFESFAFFSCFPH